MTPSKISFIGADGSLSAVSVWGETGIPGVNLPV